MPDQIGRLRESSMGEDLYSYLFNRKALPTVKDSYYLGEGIRGHYTPDNNTVTVLKDIISPDTITHEMGHAADTALSNQYWNRPMSWSRPDKPTQFTQAYDKLAGTTANTEYKSQREALVDKLNKAWSNKNADYRANHRELAGWAVGQQAHRKGDYSPPNHLDPTLATEISILMDLGKRGDTLPPSTPSTWDKMNDLVKNLFKK